MGPIAKRLIKVVRQQAKQKVIDLEAVRHGRVETERLAADVARYDTSLGGSPPAFAYFAYCQNHLSVLVEIVTGLREMSRFANAIEAAEEQYMPLGPPMSPLTNSYFSSWAYFDLSFGMKKESLATCLIELARVMKMHPSMVQAWSALSQSRLGIYRCEEVDGTVSTLRELVTGETYRCLVGSDYVGTPGEIWLVRLLPVPPVLFDGYLTTITPYVWLPSEEGWEAFFERTLPADPAARVESYEALMKFGQGRNYWNDYISEAYVNHRSDAIYLTGVPDVSESLPHAR